MLPYLEKRFTSKLSLLLQVICQWWIPYIYQCRTKSSFCPYCCIYLMCTSVELKWPIIAGSYARKIFTIWSKSFCKPCSKKCGFIIWRLYQFNGAKNFKRCFCQKNIFFLSQLTCWLSSTNLIPSGTLGLCCAHIVRLMTLQQFCAWLFTLQLCY